jgi:hypothetical protein
LSLPVLWIDTFLASISASAAAPRAFHTGGKSEFSISFALFSHIATFY